jgi:hypothetical protein
VQRQAVDPSGLSEICATLLAEVREGRPDAWERLLDRFGDMVLAVPRDLGLSPPDCEDVFQSTWLALHRSIPSIREPGALAAWILTTARRESLAALRARRETAAGAGPAAALGPDDELGARTAKPTRCSSCSRSSAGGSCARGWRRSTRAAASCSAGSSSRPAARPTPTSPRRCA